MDVEVNSLTINDFVIKNVNTNLITFIIVILSVVLIQTIILQCYSLVKMTQSFRRNNISYLAPSLDP